jgi:MarR family 2-MHQ and catechol resistance regulon transcriptional repressor
MTPHQLIALGVITTQEKMSFKELRHILAVPMSSFTFVIDKLEKQKLVKRYRDAGDRRQWLVRPTSKGKILGGEIHKKESEVLEALLDQVPGSEK